MKKKQLDRSITMVLICTLITLAAWIGFQVYRAYSQVPLPEGIDKHLQPLEPTLETSVLDRLEQRQP
jgi:hypothetical protein